MRRLYRLALFVLPRARQAPAAATGSATCVVPGSFSCCLRCFGHCWRGLSVRHEVCYHFAHAIKHVARRASFLSCEMVSQGAPQKMERRYFSAPLVVASAPLVHFDALAIPKVWFQSGFHEKLRVSKADSFQTNKSESKFASIW